MGYPENDALTVFTSRALQWLGNILRWIPDFDRANDKGQLIRNEPVRVGDMTPLSNQTRFHADITAKH